LLAIKKEKEWPMMEGTLLNKTQKGAGFETDTPVTGYHKFKPLN
jgi:hypothetical protein